MRKIYDIPSSVNELFAIGETSYSVIDYSPEMDLNNYDALEFFLDYIGCPDDYLLPESSPGEAFVEHPDYDYALCIESHGLGDFFSHGFDVYKYSK